MRVARRSLARLRVPKPLQPEHPTVEFSRITNRLMRNTATTNSYIYATASNKIDGTIVNGTATEFLKHGAVTTIGAIVPRNWTAFNTRYKAFRLIRYVVSVVFTQDETTATNAIGVAFIYPQQAGNTLTVGASGSEIMDYRHTKKKFINPLGSNRSTVRLSMSSGGGHDRFGDYTPWEDRETPIATVGSNTGVDGRIVFGYISRDNATAIVANEITIQVSVTMKYVVQFINRDVNDF